MTNTPEQIRAPSREDMKILMDNELQILLMHCDEDVVKHVRTALKNERESQSLHQAELEIELEANLQARCRLQATINKQAEEVSELKDVVRNTKSKLVAAARLDAAKERKIVRLGNALKAAPDPSTYAYTQSNALIVDFDLWLQNVRDKAIDYDPISEIEKEQG